MASTLINITKPTTTLTQPLTVPKGYELVPHTLILALFGGVAFGAVMAILFLVFVWKIGPVGRKFFYSDNLILAVDEGGTGRIYRAEDLGSALRVKEKWAVGVYAKMRKSGIALPDGRKIYTAYTGLATTVSPRAALYAGDLKRENGGPRVVLVNERDGSYRLTLEDGGREDRGGRDGFLEAVAKMRFSRIEPLLIFAHMSFMKEDLEVYSKEELSVAKQRDELSEKLNASLAALGYNELKTQKDAIQADVDSMAAAIQAGRDWNGLGGKELTKRYRDAANELARVSERLSKADKRLEPLRQELRQVEERLTWISSQKEKVNAEIAKAERALQGEDWGAYSVDDYRQMAERLAADKRRGWGRVVEFGRVYDVHDFVSDALTGVTPAAWDQTIREEVEIDRVRRGTDTQRIGIIIIGIIAVLIVGAVILKVV